MKRMDELVPAVRVRFGGFELDRRSGELYKSGVRLRLQEGPLRALEALLDRSGEIVTRQELQRRLWPNGTFVDFDNGLNSAINRLRAVLGDSADKPRFVETVGRRGYRFIAPLSAANVVAEAGRPALALSAPAEMRLAVLPFRQLKTDPDTQFLSFSLADAIASSLSGLEFLVVRSAIAAARFTSDAPDLAGLATALNVNLVLTGTILRVGDRVRVSTQLVEVPHGTLLWTTTAEALLEDLFAVSDDLVRRIVESLALPLTVREAGQLRQDVPSSGHGYTLYLRANALGRYPDTWTQARDLYLASVRADPRYAPAWAGLGRIYRMIAKYAPDEDPQLIGLAEESFRRALAANPELSLAHYLYAQLELETGRSVNALIRLLDRARERRADPKLFAGLVQACRYVGLLEASRAAHQRARQLDPVIRTSIGYTSVMAADYERAVAEARDNEDPLEGLALILAGRDEESIEVLLALRVRYGRNHAWSTFIEMALATARRDWRATMAAARTCLQYPFRDPEGWFHVCLMIARANETTGLLDVLRHTVGQGFACLPALSGDPALRILHGLTDFEPLRAEVERRHLWAAREFETAGGRELLT